MPWKLLPSLRCLVSLVHRHETMTLSPTLHQLQLRLRFLLLLLLFFPPPLATKVSSVNASRAAARRGFFPRTPATPPPLGEFSWGLASRQAAGEVAGTILIKLRCDRQIDVKKNTLPKRNPGSNGMSVPIVLDASPTHPMS